MKTKRGVWKNFELKIVSLILFVTLSLTLSFYFLIYNQYQVLTIENLKNDAEVVYQYVEELLDTGSFTELNTIDDEEKEVYHSTQQQLQQIRRIANIRYLYTAKRTASGEYIYVVDGLDPEAEDFYHVGTPIEDEIVTELSKCLDDQAVMGDEIKVTEWGIVFVTYFPVHAEDGTVLGAIGMEFDCELLYAAFTRVRQLTVIISIVIMLFFSAVAVFILTRVVGTTEAELQKKDEQLIAAREEALENSRAKSNFLSRMSHEIRTPMNAIIGMTKIAETAESAGKLKYCLDTIGASSNQLLGIINDILDISKIEAGKFELELAPLRVEKVLMKVCNLILDKAEQKNQTLDIQVDGNTRMRYIGDELRLSQVLTNLLSNAVKFTGEHGSITLTVKETVREETYGVLQFAVADTGIGMTEKQMETLFTPFSQADESITRRFGGTGLGLAISKSIVEKMNGKMWVESEQGEGSRFVFEIPMERAAQDDEAVIFSGITPSDLKLLVVDASAEICRRFTEVTGQFGMHTDAAESAARAVGLVQSAGAAGQAYDVIFLDYGLPDMDGISAAKTLSGLVDKNTVIIMTSFGEWSKIEGAAASLGIHRFLAKPLFPSSILDAINDVVGNTIKQLNMETGMTSAFPDFSGITLLLTEDVDINREIFTSLLEETHIAIDTAENGRIAVEKFAADPEKYDIIVMDVQMPEMDGYEATRLIRAMDAPRAQSVPIIAMTANAFKEDVDKCIACGMDDHLAKPIDMRAVFEKILLYTQGRA